MATRTFDITVAITNPDNPDKLVDINQLGAAVQSEPAITIKLVDVLLQGNDLVFEWAAELPDQAQEDALTAIVAAHDGVTLADAPIQVDTGDPREPDGKSVVVISPATRGFSTWLHGAGDDKAALAGAQRGEGQAIFIEYAADETGIKEVELEYLEPIEVHDGQLCWYPPMTGWTGHDVFELYGKISATVTASTPGTGNVNLVPYPGGVPGMNIVIPAMGDGSHTVDLSKAAPVPANLPPPDEESGNGFWDVDYKTGTITASTTPGTAMWHLLDFEAPPGYLVRKIRTINSMGLFDVDVYKTEYMHPNWKMVFRVTKTSSHNEVCAIGGWLLAFRQIVTA